MAQNKYLSTTLRVLIGLASFGIAATTLKSFVPLFNSTFLALIIVITVAPVLHWLRRKGVPDWLAFVTTVAGTIIVIAALVLLIGVSINQLVKDLPTYESQMKELRDNVGGFAAGLGLGAVDPRGLVDLINMSSLLDTAVVVVRGLAGALSDVILAATILIFLLVESFGFSRKLALLAQSDSVSWDRVSRFGTGIRRYVAMTAAVGGITGLGNAILLLAMGVDFAVLWGLLAFLLSYIPFVGFWLALIPPFMLALLEFGPLQAVIVFAGFVVINGLAENVVKPRFMGEGLNLSPTVVFLSLIFWTIILGAMGTVLSLPLTIALKQLLLEADEQNRWVAELISWKHSAELSPGPEALDDQKSHA